LEKSLYNRLKIELELEERLDAIEFVGETPERLCQTLEPRTKAIAKFDELGEGRTLLILGKPGSGKTITLLEIAQELIERAEKDPELPIPVVFNLSSWNRGKWTMKDWLAQEFETGIYKIPKEISKFWIQNQQLLLLLDGLDEVRQDLRELCVQVINQFSQDFGQTEIIVCSRIKAYEAIAQPLRFQAALLIHPLTLAQIQDFLEEAREEFLGIKLSLQTDPVLQELARSPLMLSIMVLAYQGIPASAFDRMSLEERQQHIWDRYVDRMLSRKQENPRHPQNQNLTLHWLRFLAKHMIQESQTIFLIERINPGWLKPGVQRQLYPLIVGLVAGLFIEWVYGLPLGLLGSQLNFHMLIGLMSGFVLGVVGSLSGDIKLFTAMGWSWSLEKAWKAAIPGLLGGPTIGGFIWLIGRPLNLVPSGSLNYLMLLSLFTGAVVASISALFAGLVVAQLNIETASKPLSYNNTNQGIWQSANRAGLTTLLTLIIIVLPINIISAWFIPFSAILGCISLYSGGIACLQHLILRLILWQDKFIPWNYADFLDSSTEKMMLQKSGGGYQFLHNILRRKISLSSDSNESREFKGLMPRSAFITLLLTMLLAFGIFLPLTFNTWRIALPTKQVLIPSLYKGDRLLVETINFRPTKLHRWDIISFQPTLEMKQLGFKYTRDFGQILGLPEEKVEITNGEIHVNGNALPKIYFTTCLISKEYRSMDVPIESYLVSVNKPNDNDSQDSLLTCFIPRQNIDGRALFRFWPPNRIRLTHN
jgi:signal peptidase I